MGESSERQLWDRATAILAGGNVRVMSDDEVKEECALSDLVRRWNEADEAELALKRQLIEMYEQRRKYIELFDKLLSLSEKAAAVNAKPRFWKSLVSIIKEDGDGFEFQEGDEE